MKWRYFIVGIMLPFLFIYYYLVNFIQNFILFVIFLYFILDLFFDKRTLKADEVTKLYVGLISGGIVISFFVNLASNVIMSDIRLGTAYLLIAINIGLWIFRFLTVKVKNNMARKKMTFLEKLKGLEKNDKKFIIELKSKWDDQFCYILTLIYLYYIIVFTTIFVNMQTLNLILLQAPLYSGHVILAVLIFMPLYIIITIDKKRYKGFEEIIDFLKNKK